MEAGQGEPPSVARQRVRRALREARQAMRLTQGDVAKRLGSSLSKVQRIESGEVGVSATDLRALLAVYGVEDENTIEHLSRDAAISRRARWSVPAEYREHLTPASRQLMDFESEASSIRAYQPFIFPGVLQTPAMAEFLLAWYETSLSDDTRKLRYDVRMIRRKYITEDADAPTYLLILDEAALKREVGGRRLMADQLEAAADLAQRPNIFIRIVQLSAGVLGMLGPFTVLDLSDDPSDAVLYQEHYTSDAVIHDSATVSYYRRRFEDVWHRCYGEADSLRLIRAEAASLRASLIRDP
jgi:transcriptional regulator with XRE-family HTH domain